MPLAITDCMNFGNPQRPEIMGQFVGCIEGMAEACRALDFPVVSGNVSLYNETEGTGILPTPAIGGVGLLKDWSRAATIAFKAEGEAIWLVGASKRDLGQSLWLRECHDREDGPPPRVNLNAERRVGAFIRRLIDDGEVTAVHDVSDGGPLVAIAEMALAGSLGATLRVTTLGAEAGMLSDEDLQEFEAIFAAGVDSMTTAAEAFGESQACYIITTRGRPFVEVPVAMRQIGVVGGDAVRGWDANKEPYAVPLVDLRAAHEKWLPGLMAR